LKKIIYSILILTFGLVSITKAQDPDYSQFYNSPTYYNPAYVGLNKGLRARFNYQRQWTSVPADLNSYNFSVDFAERNLPGAGGIGIIFNSAKAGIGYVRNTMIGFLPSVRIQIEENIVMQMGASAAYVQRKMDWDDLVFPDQLDPIQGNIYDTKFSGPSEDKISYPDFGVGGIFQFTGNNERVVGTLGGAIHHLTRPNESFFGKSSPLPRKYVVHFDMIFDFTHNKGFYKKTSDFKINPGIFFQTQQKMNDYALGMNIYFERVYFGAWYKNESLEYDSYSHFSLMGGISIPINDDESRVKFMYSYDMIINAEHMFAGPTHEISLIIEFDEFALIKSSTIGGVRRKGSERLECSPF
jgi:type IX secretion system PorP/SprF family membrane protein